MTLWWYVRNRKLVEDVDSKEYLPVPIKKYSPDDSGSIFNGRY